jgi:EmrB/QacA subfamily drug resistance transporter
MTAAGVWHLLLVEPRRPAGIRDRPYAHWLVVGTVCVGAFMGQLDASIVTQAFPTLQHGLHASLASVQWVGLAYLLVLVSLVAAVGRIADMVGRKLLYSYGFFIFILGSALCGLAPNLPTLIAFRAVQAFGAAMLQANSVAIIASAMPPNELGRGIGVQGAAQALGLALGPAVGGLLISLGGWRLIFYVNVPVGLVGLLLGLFLVPRSRHLAERKAFDWGGLALFVPVVAALLVALSYGNDLGWTSALVLVMAAVALVGAPAFVLRQRRARAPMLDLRLFSRVPFSVGVASGLLSYVVLFGVLLVVPYLLQLGAGMSAARSGLELMVMPVGLGIVAPAAGKLAERWGASRLTTSGMLLTSTMLVVLAACHGTAGPRLAALALIGAGLGLFTPPNNAAIMGAAPRTEAGLASGVLNMTRGMGTSLGIALTGLVFGAFAGEGPHASGSVGRGFDAAALFLAGVALLAALVAGFRGPRTLDFNAAQNPG